VSSFTIDEGGIFQGNCDITPDKKEMKSKPEIKQQDEKNNQNKNHKNEKNSHHNQNTKKTVS
jgi:cytoskeletal protein CcmA (bactofilin family)